MNSLLRLTKIELLKIKKHRLTWGVLFALVLVLGLQMNSLRRDAHEHPLSETAVADTSTMPPAQTEDGFDMSIFDPPVTNQDYWDAATLPGVFAHYWRMVDWLNIVVIVLGIIFVGQEFSWGTLRMALARGVKRSHLVWAKFVALGLTTAVYLLI
ncbi:MAG: ABC transporter permease, partial [Chloroflexi bacterium]|nr:ABC transporter permease [Chloroflexota bacterium]